MKKTNCPNCQNKKRKIVLDVSKEKDIFLEHIKIDWKNIKRGFFRCQNCGLIYQTPILDEKEKELLYEHNRDIGLRKENKYEYFNRITSLPPDQSENYQRYVFLEKYLPKEGIILDVGCGGGVFLYSFKKYFPNWETLGIEPTKDFADVAKEKGINIIYGYLKEDTLDKKFDLITLILVLEHLDNFKEMLSMLKHYLKEQGLLYIEVPSDKDIGYLPSSHDRFMCEHNVIFSKEVLENILTKLGYSVVTSEDSISIRGRNNIRIVVKNNG